MIQLLYKINKLNQRPFYFVIKTVRDFLSETRLKTLAPSLQAPKVAFPPTINQPLPYNVIIDSVLFQQLRWQNHHPSNDGAIKI